MQKKYIHSLIKDISNIGLGCVTFGREISKHDSWEILDYAVDSGITHLDTAPSYSNGASESILGEWLYRSQPLNNSLIISSKISPPFGKDSIINSVKLSLERLKISYVDVLYVHQWHPSVNNLEVQDALTTLVNDNKVKLIGASNFTAEELQNAIDIQTENHFIPFRFMQNNNNYAIRDIYPELSEICKRNDINIVTYSPLGAGFLSGKYQDEIKEGTRFSVIPEHIEIYFQQLPYRRLKELLAISRRTGLPATHLALSWALRQKGIDSVLIGARNKKHIDQALDSLNYDFPFPQK